MFLTGDLATSVDDLETTVSVKKGFHFEINNEAVVALEYLTITLTGITYHTNPPQKEIASIIGEYEST